MPGGGKADRREENVTDKVRWAAIVLVMIASATMVDASGIVRLHGSSKAVQVALRAEIQAGTRISGIEFVGGAACVYPRVFIAEDSDGAQAAPGRILAVAKNVKAGPGIVRVALTEVPISHGSRLWAVVELPEAPAGSEGQSRPGIGWRKEKRLAGEAAYFFVDGNMQQFQPTFDLRMITSPEQASLPSLGPVLTPPAVSDAEDVAEFLAVALPSAGPGTIRLRLAAPREGQLHVRVFDIAGRRIDSIQRNIPRGVHVLEWLPPGRRLHRGVYFFEAMLDGARRKGRILIAP